MYRLFRLKSISKSWWVAHENLQSAIAYSFDRGMSRNLEYIQPVDGIYDQTEHYLADGASNLQEILDKEEPGFACYGAPAYSLDELHSLTQEQIAENRKRTWELY